MGNLSGPGAAPGDWLRRFHLGPASVRGAGSFDVRRARTRFARSVCALLRVPVEGSGVPVRIEIEREGDRELWTRRFGGRRYVTRQVRGSGSRTERIGPLELRFRVVATDATVSFEPESSALRVGPLGLRLPAPLAPRVHAHAESRGEAAFFVRVEVNAPARVPLFCYSGMVTEV
ncbi:MAG TPA: DUF4166 domain-containing protein [Micromonosporaceae bacterium]|nr:DUF4166 domain-containing protein [Micromonosporaceae bacterium]